MDFLILLLLALDLGAFGLNYPDFQKQNVHTPFIEEENYNGMVSSSCTTTTQPLCGTNGKEFIYFENKCEFELKNHEMLTQGIMEYDECPLNFCKPDCASWDLSNEPAKDITGSFEDFPNSYDVELIPYTTSQKDFLIVDFHEYNSVGGDSSLSQSNIQEEEEEDFECPKFCSLRYKPICAIFMTLEKEFLNECELKTTICQTKQKWSILKEGPCQPSNNDDDDAAPAESVLVESRCPHICPFEYKPICAKLENKFKEFANGCELESTKCQLKQDWQIINEGSCLDIQSYLNAEVVYPPTALKCSQVCTSEYRPVCAKLNNELREFSNKCKLERTKCETNEKWEIVNTGKCVMSSPITTSVAKACLKSCSKKYSPVCAAFENEIREFSNKCLLENWNCESDKKWEIKNLGPCSLDSKDKVSADSKCPTFCTQIFNPVCAKLGNELKEFSNGCELQRTNCESKTTWKVHQLGPCLPTTTTCPKSCPNNYKPVCAVFKLNLKEFQNECQLQKTICETNENWQILKKGRCPLVPKSKGVCPNFCTKAFSPVCARYKDELKEFFNTCELQKRKCETNMDWKIFNRGPCLVKTLTGFANSSCEKEVLDPICAELSLKFKTFKNICQLAQEIEKTQTDWSILHKGNCTKASPATKLLESNNNKNSLRKVSSTVTTDKSTYTAITPARSTIKLKSSVVATTAVIPKTTTGGSKYSAIPQTLIDISKKKYAIDELKFTTETSNKDFTKIPLIIKSKESVSQTVGKNIEDKSTEIKKESTSHNDSSRDKLRCGISRENKENNTMRSLETVKIKNDIKVDRKNITHSNKTYSSKVVGNNKITKAEAAADNAESAVKVLEALLDENDDEEEDIDTLLGQVSNSAGGKVTEKETEGDTQLNSSKFEQNSTKLNNSNSKKGAIYNGVVYKGAVYDAPTYNIIYTAPNHYVIPLNYPTSAATANTSFDLLKLVLAMNRGLIKPNLSPIPEGSEGKVSTSKGNLVELNKNPIELEKSLSKLPFNSFGPAKSKDILTQNHPSPPMFLPLSPEQLMPFLAAINSSSASQIQNSPVLQRNRENENKQKHNFAAPQAEPKFLNPFSINSLLQETPEKLLTKASGKISRVSSQPLTHSHDLSSGHHSIPAPFKPVHLNATNSSKYSFNSTVWNEIMKTIKTISNRF